MKKKGNKILRFSADQILKLINDNEVTNSKEFKKFQEYKKSIKDYDKKRNEPNPKIDMLAEEFKMEMKRRGQYVEEEDIKLMNQNSTKNERQELNLNINESSSNNFNINVNEYSLNNDLIDKLLIEDSIEENIANTSQHDEYQKIDFTTMKNKHSDLNNLLNDINSLKRKSNISKKILIKSDIKDKSNDKNTDKISQQKDEFQENFENKLYGNIINIAEEAQPKKNLILPEISKDLKSNFKDININLDENDKNSLTKTRKNELVEKYPHKEIEKIINCLENKQLNTLHQYDTIQLIAALKYLEFKVENIESMINMISYIRKKKNLKIYDFPEIENAIIFIKKNLKDIEDTFLISLFYSLSKMNYDKELIIFELLNEITTRHDKLNIRLISNLAYALSNFQLKFPKKFNFDNYLRDIESEVIKKLYMSKKFDIIIDTQSLGNLILAYCKTQNGSIEFYRILEEFIEDKKKKFLPKELVNIVYSYSNNRDCSERLLEVLYQSIMSNIRNFKAFELCTVLRAYHKRNMVSDDLKSIIIENFIDKHEFMNSTDLSYFYAILAKDVNIQENNDVVNNELIKQDNKIKFDERFMKFAHLCIENLAFSFTGRDLSVLYEKIKLMQEKSPKTFEKIKNQTLKLMKKNDIKGSDLNIIYTHTMGLKYEDKYDIFNEKIEQHLKKLKYNR